MAADRFYIKQNDQRPDLKVRLLDEDQPVDLTNAAGAKFLMRNRRQGLRVDADMTILDQSQEATLGVVSYAWQPGDTASSGDFNGEIQITWPGGEVQTFPADGYIQVVITKDLSGTNPSGIN